MLKRSLSLKNKEDFCVFSVEKASIGSITAFVFCITHFDLIFFKYSQALPSHGLILKLVIITDFQTCYSTLVISSVFLQLNT